MAAVMEREPRRLTVAEYHRMVEAELYARHGVPECWIVNLEAEAIEIHRDPDPAAARWGTRAVVARGEVTRPASVPGVAVPVDGLFG